MAQRIPYSTQWVTFPTNPWASVVIRWNEGRLRRNAVYYHCTCYWGTLKDAEIASAAIEKARQKGSKVVKAADESEFVILGKLELNTREYSLVCLKSLLHYLGSTRIFIAQEYVEHQFQGGPAKGFHLRDLAGLKAPEKKPEGKHILI